MIENRLIADIGRWRLRYRPRGSIRRRNDVRVNLEVSLHSQTACAIELRVGRFDQVDLGRRYDPMKRPRLRQESANRVIAPDHAYGVGLLRVILSGLFAFRLVLTDVNPGLRRTLR